MKVTIKAPRTVCRKVQKEVEVAANWLADEIGVPSSHEVLIKLNTRRKKWSTARNITVDRTEIQLATDKRGLNMASAISLQVLAHELIHARQYALSELKTDIYEMGMGWRQLWAGPVEFGAHGKYIKGHGRGLTNYRKLPWEKEAYSRQIELAAKFWEADKKHNLLAVAKEASVERVITRRVRADKPVSSKFEKLWIEAIQTASRYGGREGEHTVHIEREWLLEAGWATSYATMKNGWGRNKTGTKAAAQCGWSVRVVNGNGLPSITTHNLHDSDWYLLATYEAWE